MARFSLPEVAQSVFSLARFCAMAKDLLARREGQSGQVKDRSVLIEDLEAWGFPCSEFDVFDLLFVPALGMKLAGAHDPGLATFLSGTLAYAFDKAADEELLFTAALPYGYREGAEIIPLALWAPSGTDTTGAVVWGLELTWASQGVAFQATQTITATSNPEGTAHQLKAARFSAFPGPGKKIGSVIQGRVYRDADNGSDGYDEDAYLLGVGFVFAKSSVGGRKAFTK
jgi:hypothetical protein